MSVTETREISVCAEIARRHGTDLLVGLGDPELMMTGFKLRAPTLEDVLLAITGAQLHTADTGAG